jgi:hypothetical protein
VIETKSLELNQPIATQTAVNVAIPPPSPVPAMNVQQDKQEKVDTTHSSQPTLMKSAEKTEANNV